MDTWWSEKREAALAGGRGKNLFQK